MAINLKVGGLFKTEGGDTVEILGHYPPNVYPWVGVVKFDRGGIAVAAWDDNGVAEDGPHDIAIPKHLYVAQMFIGISAEDADDLRVVLERLQEVDGVVAVSAVWDRMAGAYIQPRVIDNVDPEDVDPDESLTDHWHKAGEANSVQL